MRKSICKDVLTALVNATCSNIDSFSAYDITQILRKQLPSREILHDDVKPIVLDFALNNQMSVIDNGTYRVFTKQFKGVKPSTNNSVKVIFDGREPDDNSTGITVSSLDKAKSMINSFGKVIRLDVKKAVDDHTNTLKFVRRYNLQSEGRLVLPYDIVGSSQRKVHVNGRVLNICAGQRFRTGLSCQMVDVKVYDNRIEIVPV